MIAGGSTVARIRNESGEDAYALVKSLLNNSPLPTQLQEELHSGKSLIETGAGTQIRDELVKLEKKLRKENRVEIEELKRAHELRKLIFC